MKRKYWYRIYRGECPVCGRVKEYRERVYGKKPKSFNKTHIRLDYSETYDWCDV